MAEIIELRSEDTIPELETMLQLLFSKEEVQSLTNMRKEHEYRIHRSGKRKEDCIKYIDFEMKLMKMIRLRHQKKGLQKNSKITSLMYALGSRLNKIFVFTIRWFPGDFRLWVMYIKFCRQMRFSSAASRVLEQMLELHGNHKPELYKEAAMWELNECSSIEKARKYLMMGIHKHKDSKLLLTEAFKLELIDADRKRKECAEKNLPIDPANPHVSAKKAELIYDTAIKKMKDVELMNDLLNICNQYSFASGLQARINNDMFDHDANERMWDIIARRELDSEERLTPKNKIANKCIPLYEEACKRLNTTLMWSYYINAMAELTKDPALPNFKQKVLINALQKGAAAGKLVESHYILWADRLSGPDKHKRLVEMLQGGVRKIPDSVNLWKMLLREHLHRGEEKQANQVFEEGVAALAEKSLPLWKLMLQFEQTKRNNKVEEIFKKSWNQRPEVSGPLKPMYLEWLVLTQGIVVARKAYDQLCEATRLNLETHKKMLYLESIQPTNNMKRMRQCYTIACAQFGETDIDVWLDHSKFEISCGDPEKVSLIMMRAQKNLSPQLFDTFSAEINLLKNLPHPLT